MHAPAPGFLTYVGMISSPHKLRDVWTCPGEGEVTGRWLGTDTQWWKLPPFPQPSPVAAYSGQSSWPLLFPLPAGTFKGPAPSASQDVHRDHSLLTQGTWSQDQQDPTAALAGPQGVGRAAVPAARVLGAHSQLTHWPRCSQRLHSCLRGQSPFGCM